MQTIAKKPIIEVPSQIISQPKSHTNRLVSIDITRGVAMLFMLISHSTWWLSDIVYRANFGWDTTDPIPVLLPDQQVAWFGLILSVASPIFFTLTGFGLALFIISRKKYEWSEWQITRYMLIRGAVLIGFDLLILAWRWSPGEEIEYKLAAHAVLLSIGVSLWIIAFLRRLKPLYLLAIALSLTLAMQILYASLEGVPTSNNLLRALFLYPTPNDSLILGYPVFSWLPVILFGFVSANYVAENRDKFGQFTLMVSLTSWVLWTIVMVVDGFGRLYNEHVLIFTKHPPSLAYLFFYGGIVFMLLYLFHRFDNLMNVYPIKVLSLLGQTALFFFVTHRYVVFAVSLVMRKLPFSQIVLSFLITTVSLVILYNLCFRYRIIRKNNPDSILKYL